MSLLHLYPGMLCSRRLGLRSSYLQTCPCMTSLKRPKEVAYLRLVSGISKPIIIRWVRHSWISYVDANNLYGWAMSQFLPIGNYQWEASREYLLKNPAMQKKYLLNIKAHFTLKTH